MTYQLAGSIAITLYCCAALYQGHQLWQKVTLSLLPLRIITTAALIFHGITASQLIFTEGGLGLGFFSISINILFFINLVLLIGSFSKQLSPLLFFPLLGFSSLVLLTALLVDNPSPDRVQVPFSIAVHIVSSILSYSLLTLASLQALALALQNWLLRHKHLSGSLKNLPPLQVTEALLFELLWVGFILLSVSLATGILFFDNIFEQQLVHKIFFSSVGWVFYATLLWGRHTKGWRGNTAIKWTLGGFVALILAYWGSRLVIEFILNG